MNTITKGDKVKHKTLFLNGGIPMGVTDIKEGMALCAHVQVDKNGEDVFTETWYSLADLEKVIYGKE